MPSAEFLSIKDRCPQNVESKRESRNYKVPPIVPKFLVGVSL
jgi:hypothetical protein